MGAGTTVSILPCGAMTADLTWLLLAPGRAIRNRQNKHLPAEWVDVPTHCVLVDTPDGKLLWDTSCPRDWEQRWAPTGLQDFFPYEKVSDDEYLDSRLKQLGLAPGDIDWGQLHPDAGAHAGQHVDADRPARDRHDDLHGRRGLHGRELRSPTVPAAIVNNLEQFYSSVEKLRAIATKADATMVFGHDPDQIKQLRVAPTGSYR